MANSIVTSFGGRFITVICSTPNDLKFLLSNGFVRDDLRSEGVDKEVYFYTAKTIDGPDIMKMVTKIHEEAHNIYFTTSRRNRGPLDYIKLFQEQGLLKKFEARVADK